MSAPVLVFAESFGSRFRRAAFEVVTEGRRLADITGAEERALVIGQGLKEKAGELGKYGADRILVADDPALALFHPDYYRQIMLEAVKKCSPSIILIPATSTGKDLAPRIAVHLNTGVASECTQLDLQNGELIATRPAYPGKVLLKVKINGTPKIATLRPNAFTAKEASPAHGPSVESLAFENPETRMVVKEFAALGPKKMDLTEASIIVSGGGGVGGAQKNKT